MKKIFSIVCFLVCSIISFGQNGNWGGTTQLPGTANTISQSLGPVRGNGGIILPSFFDTASANLNSKVNSVAGTQIFVTSINSICVRSSDTKRWIILQQSLTPCLPNQLIPPGSVTWNGINFGLNATPLDYIIDCRYWHSLATSLTLQTSDPSFGRWDLVVADTFNLVTIITGVPSINPQKPLDQFNPFSQIVVAEFFVPAGSSHPNQTATVIYNNNNEWVFSTNTSGVSNSGTTPYIAPVNCYIPNPSLVTNAYMQFTNSSSVDITQQQFINLWVKIDGATDKLMSLAFYNNGTQITAYKTVSDGVFGFNGNLLNTWQLVSIPITGPIGFGNFVNKLNILLSASVPHLQVDYVYLISGATSPSTGNPWTTDGTDVSTVPNPRLGTTSPNDLNIITNDTTRLIVPKNGITEDSTLHNMLMLGSDGKTVYKAHRNVLTGLGCIKIVPNGTGGWGIEDTCSSGGSGWGLTGNAGTTVGANFLGTTDNVGLMFKTNSVQSGYIDLSHNNTSLGYQSLLNNSSGGNNSAFGFQALKTNTSGGSNTAFGVTSLTANTTGSSNAAFGGGFNLSNNTTGNSNTGIGVTSLSGNTTGNYNTGVGNFTLSGDGGSIIGNATGSGNTAIGYFAGVTTNATDSSGSFGVKAFAASHQMAFSPYFTQFKVTGITGNNVSGNVLTTDGSGIATFQAPSGGGGLFPLTGTGTATGNVIGDIGSNNLDIAGIGNTNFHISPTDKVIDFYSNSGDDQVYLDGTNHLFRVTTNDNEYFQQSTDGFVFMNKGVGIGTATPSAPLQIHTNGDYDVYFSGAVYNSETGMYGSRANEVIATSDGDFCRYGGITSGGALIIDNGTSNIGIGIAPTSNKLEVNGNQNNTGTLTVSSTTTLTDLVAGGIVTASTGVGVLSVTNAGVISTSRATGQTGASTLATYTVGASDASYEVSANVLVTTATLHSFTARCVYTDEGNTSRTLTLNFSTIAGVLTPTIANAGGAVPYEGVPLHIRCKAGTTIVFSTAGTFTTVAYNFERSITQLTP